jgi:hypothetical protein
MTFQWSKRAPYLKYKKQNRIHQNEGKNKIESGKAATLRTLPNITSNDPIVFQIVTIVDLSNQPPTIPDLVSAASAYRPIFRRPHATGGLGSAQEVRLRHGRMDLQRCRVPIIETMSTRETTATMSPWWHQRLQGRWLQSIGSSSGSGRISGWGGLGLSSFGASGADGCDRTDSSLSQYLWRSVFFFCSFLASIMLIVQSSVGIYAGSMHYNSVLFVNFDSTSRYALATHACLYIKKIIHKDRINFFSYNRIYKLTSHSNHGMHRALCSRYSCCGICFSS